MNNLNQFLKIFEGYLDTEEGANAVIVEVFRDVLGVSFQSEDIKRGEFSLFLDTHPVIKNEVLLNKEKLLLALKKKTGRSFDSIF